MNDQHLIAIMRDAEVTLMRAQERIAELEAENERLTHELAKVTKKLTKTRQTIRRMEEGEL